MNPKLKKFIEKGGFWLAEGAVNFQIVYVPARAFARTRRYSDLGWSIILFVVKNQYGYQYLKINESMDIMHKLLEGNKLEKHYQLWKKKLKNYIKFEKKFEKIDISKISNKELSELYQKVTYLIIDSWDLSILIEGTSIYGGFLIKRLQDNYGVSSSEATIILNTLGKSPKQSFVVKEHINFLKLCLLYKKKGFEKKLKEHQKKYFWIENNYKTMRVISVDEFRDRVKEYKKDPKTELKQLAKKETSKFKLNREDSLLLKKFGKISMWIDDRKELTLKGNHLMYVIFQEVGKRFNLSLKEVCLTFPEELPLIIEKKKKVPSKSEFKKRNVILGIGDGLKKKNQIFIGKEAEKIIDYLEKVHEKESPKIIKGMPSWNFGKVKGNVQIVLDIEKTKFEKGNILVTSSTRPEFVPIMKKAKAIITNEGGITSHAAIVSRELKIPCIVGTKNATNLLKTGDKIELDSKKGKVRKI